jgi:hypothetical protein
VAEERTAKDIVAGSASFEVVPGDFVRQRGRERGVHDPLCGSATDDGQSIHVIDIERRAHAFDRYGLETRSCARKSRKASAVVANPPGTRTPNRDSWLIISPSDAFLPPTLFDVGHAQFFKGKDERFHAESFQRGEIRRLRKRKNRWYWCRGAVRQSADARPSAATGPATRAQSRYAFLPPPVPPRACVR